VGARAPGRRGASRLATLAVLLSLAGGSATARAQGLKERLDAVLDGGRMRGARVGALVVSRADGRVLYARGADQPLVPASNQKILTALAALSAFGPAHRFVTTIAAEAAPDAKGQVAHLYVRGGGDPALTSEDWWRLASDLRGAGLRAVQGDVVVDDSYFDGERWHPAWGAVSSRAYFGPVGALNANYGAFAVDVRPGPAVGSPARVELDPPLPYFRLLSQARTADVRGFAVEVARGGGEGGESVVVSGRAPARGAAKRIYRSVSDPARYAGELLRWQLAAQGIAVAGGVRRGGAPAGAVALVEFEGRPLAEIVRLFMKYSNNNVAEALVKALGAQASGPPGSWTSGVDAMAARLRALGLDLEGAAIVDGSGLSRGNRVSPRLFVSALQAADASFAIAPEFEASLPIAAADGTLARRARAVAGHVRAKTGHLDGVTTLSGYASLAGGGEAAFSLLVNGSPAGDAAAIAGIDAFVAALAGVPPSGGAATHPLQESVRRATR
jgi:D-alanyl-D-alanine carboxypeptidase/D-alanyl-D-alanine-endopeptidase (penicillin-binding protein 4)